MLAQQVAAQCALETGVVNLTQHGEELALIAIANVREDRREWHRQIKAEFRERHEYGSILLMILLPVIISLITTWLSKWIFSAPNRDDLKLEASSALKS